ncbi:hypothetical protein DFH07DRAFT_940433 [Mycena maculata]|uniref:Uncharacterized protein n=1 Tax=Mycena maculata TaxID=230809 RepID=A0AAD7J5V0_9AGAR|nr:hypothetical protein DFH07DRAFT_940433 [Mycena maculata]
MSPSPHRSKGQQQLRGLASWWIIVATEPSKDPWSEKERSARGNWTWIALQSAGIEMAIRLHGVQTFRKLWVDGGLRAPGEELEEDTGRKSRTRLRAANARLDRGRTSFCRSISTEISSIEARSSSTDMVNANGCHYDSSCRASRCNESAVPTVTVTAGLRGKGPGLGEEEFDMEMEMKLGLHREEVPGNAEGAQNETMEGGQARTERCLSTPLLSLSLSACYFSQLKQAAPVVYGRREEVLSARAGSSPPSFPASAPRRRLVVCTGVGRQDKDVWFPEYACTLVVLRASRARDAREDELRPRGFDVRRRMPHTAITMIKGASTPDRDQRAVVSTLCDVVCASGSSRRRGLVVPAFTDDEARLAT